MSQRYSLFATRNQFRVSVLSIGVGCLLGLCWLSAASFRQPVRAKAPFATITVNTTADTVAADGFCSLREAIQAANTNTAVNECPAGSAGLDTIQFNIGAGTPTINLTSALPTITDPVMINGATGGATRVELNGAGAGANANGLNITAGSSTIAGLVINRFSNSGVVLQTSGGNTIQNCLIGTNAAGTAALGNTFRGVTIFSNSNTIGGTAAGAGNVISGNAQDGIVISNGSGNVVQGNLIGTNAAGTAAIPNAFQGVSLNSPSSNTTIGGTTASARNVISGNGLNGVRMAVPNNQVLGNFIGTNAAGTAALANTQHGVSVANAANNTIGGTAAGAGNVLSGNTLAGISINGASSTGNQVQGNFIGTNAAGTAALGNGISGVTISLAPNNTIGGTTAGAGNLISGNNNEGLVITGNTATGNQVQGNFIGTNAAGTAAIANMPNGVEIDGAPNNTIGGTSAAARNVISGNTGTGIYVNLAAATGNMVQGNYIGTNAAGTAALGNGTFGLILGDAPNNTIGGTTAAARNLISGNGSSGVRLLGSGATGNTVAGNFIGTDVNGTADLGNALDGVLLEGADNNTIGGTTGTTPGGACTGACNLISGNTRDGIFMQALPGDGSNGNIAQGNYVGTNVNGTAALQNDGDGVGIQDSANNTIGGTAAAARNLISGNGGEGVSVAGVPATTFNNVVLGNYIGTNAAGAAAIANTFDGVAITAAADNIIGGTAAGAGNLISGNSSAGVVITQSTATGNQVQGNFIGTNAAGTAAVGNAVYGVVLIGSASNTVGGTVVAARNLISGNGLYGVAISGSTATNNLVQGNYIGTDVNGAVSLGNGDGVFVVTNATNNTIGGTAAGAGNLISGNSAKGIELFDNSSGTIIQGNLIGTTASGLAALPNTGNGIFLFDSPNNVIGGASAAARNVISGNNSDGISFWQPVTTGNQVFGNYIGVGADGTTAVGNNGGGFGGGVAFRNGASNNQIGGTAAGQGNVIANNQPIGVVVYSGTGNAVRGNSIFNNAGLGIDLDGDGVTANDGGDGDTGSNDLQNFPVLTSAIVGGPTTSIQGTLNSTPGTNFNLDFYSNPTCDASGNGEGRIFLGSAIIGTGDGGDATFSLTLSVSVAPGQVITATATNPGGNTSEFSPCACTYVLTPSAAGIAFTGASTMVSVTASSGCAWTAVSNTPWITITGGASGNGNGTISYTVAANPTTTPRTGSMTIAGFTFYVTQAAGGLVLDENFNNGIPPDWKVVDGGTGTLNWTTANPCGANPGAPFAPPFAIVDLSCAANNVIPDESLITPPFDARGLGQVVLQFDNWFRFAAGALNPIGDVDVSVNGGVSWVNVLRLQGATENPNTRTINLTPVIPPNSADVRVRFHYYATGGLRPNAPRGQEVSWGVDHPTILSLTVSPLPDFTSTGDSGMGMVTAPAGYTWTVVSDVPWITIVQGGSRPSGVGSGPFSFVVASYGGVCPRTGNITVTIPGGGPQPLLTVTVPVTQTGSGLTVSPASLPNGVVGAAYNQTLTATGSNAPYTFTVSAGSLPAGLSLSSGGALTGTPTTAGPFNFTVKTADAQGCMGTRDYSITIVGGGGGGLQFYPLPTPVRLLETRAAFSGCTNPGAPISAGSTFTLPARTTCVGVPAAAAAITGNITVVPSGAGYLTLFPSSAAQPTVANSNFKAGEITNNVFTVGLGAGDGAFKIFTSATTEVIIDVTGYYAPPGAGGLYFHPLATPIRLLETRSGFSGCFTPGLPLTGTGNPNADPALDLALQGRSPLPCGAPIPTTAQVLVGNATTVLPSGGGYLTIYPSGGTRPTVASSNYAGSDVINGPFAVKLGTDGKFKVYTFATTHLVIDILGYYSADATDVNGAGLFFNPLSHPVRLLETRPDFPGFPLAGCFRTNAPIPGGTGGIRTQPAWGTCDSLTIPNTARSIIGNVTVINPVAAGFLTFYPGDITTAPTVATSNYPSPVVFGYNRHYFVGLSPADGTFKMLTQFTTDLIVDVSGYFAP